MTQHEDLIYLARMLEMANAATNMATGKTIDELRGDQVLQLALTHALGIIGEAARHVSPVTKAELAAIPWDQIVGMRHRIVHNYFDISLDRVWDTVSQDLSPLIAALEPVVPSEPPE
jgi:uncharacterized protein with HEPN domain